MPRLAPRTVADLAQHEPMLHALEEAFGFMPNDFLTLGHKPAILKAVVDLTGAVLFAEGATPLPLRLLVMYIASRAAGCRYCTAHLAGLCAQHGIAQDKIAAINDYAVNPAFSPAERAALTVADLANRIPNAVSDGDFARLREHFTDEAIAEIVSQIALMSFYNKWNDTLATTLEKPPAEAAGRMLPWWSAGKHA